MTKEKVRFSLERDREYVATHSIMEVDYALPSGVDKLDYIPAGRDSDKNQFRQLVHLETGEWVNPSNVWFNFLDLTWRTRVEEK